MAIPKAVLKEMNDLLKQGKTSADLARKYSQYDYWEIYYEPNSFQKRKLSFFLLLA